MVMCVDIDKNQIKTKQKQANKQTKNCFCFGFKKILKALKKLEIKGPKSGPMKINKGRQKFDVKGSNGSCKFLPILTPRCWPAA